MSLMLNKHYASTQLYNKFLNKKQSHKDDLTNNSNFQYNMSSAKSDLYSTNMAFTGYATKALTECEKNIAIIQLTNGPKISHTPKISKKFNELFNALVNADIGTPEKSKQLENTKKEVEKLVKNEEILKIFSSYYPRIINKSFSNNPDKSKTGMEIMKWALDKNLIKKNPVNLLDIVFNKLFDNNLNNVSNATELIKLFTEKHLITQKPAKTEILYKKLLGDPETENYFMEVIGCLGDENLLEKVPDDVAIFIQDKAKSGNSIAENAFDKLRKAKLITQKEFNVTRVPYETLESSAASLKKADRLVNITNINELFKDLSVDNITKLNDWAHKGLINDDNKLLLPEHIREISSLMGSQDKDVAIASMKLMKTLLNKTKLAYNTKLEKKIFDRDIRNVLENLDDENRDLVKTKLILLIELHQKGIIIDSKDIISLRNIRTLLKIANNDDSISNLSLIFLQKIADSNFKVVQDLYKIYPEKIDPLFDKLNPNSATNKIILTMKFIRSLAKADGIKDISKINVGFISSQLKSGNPLIKDTALGTMKQLIQSRLLKDVSSEDLDIILQDLGNPDSLKAKNSLLTFIKLFRNRPNGKNITVSENKINLILSLMKHKDPAVANIAMDATRTIAKTKLLSEFDKNTIESIYENMADPYKEKMAIETVNTLVDTGYLDKNQESIVNSVYKKLIESDNRFTKDAAVRAVNQFVNSEKVNEVPPNVIEGLVKFISDLSSELNNTKYNKFDDLYNIDNIPGSFRECMNKPSKPLQKTDKEKTSRKLKLIHLENALDTLISINRKLFNNTDRNLLAENKELFIKNKDLFRNMNGYNKISELASYID